MHHPTDRIAHTTAFVTPVVEHWLEREIVQRVHHNKGSIQQPITPSRSTLLPDLATNMIQDLHFQILTLSLFQLMFFKKATYIGCLNVFRMFGHVSIPYLLLHHTLISTTSVGFTINYFFNSDILISLSLSLSLSFSLSLNSP